MKLFSTTKKEEVKSVVATRKKLTGTENIFLCDNFTGPFGEIET